MFKGHSRRRLSLMATPTASHARARNETLSHVFSNGFPYSSKLSAHTSCVNAVAFSNGDARFLVSGGDDRRICLWDFHQDDLITPAASLYGPRGNIFCTTFSSSNRYLFIGGTNEIILQYDIANLSLSQGNIPDSPQTTFREHEDTIRGIACHPFQDEVFLSASQDGRILHHDMRTSTDNRSRRAQDTIQLPAEATDVKFHPNLEHIFVTSDSHGVVCLRDTRMAFGPSTARTQDGVVQTYNTKICKKTSPHLCNPEVGSVAFDREGTKLAVSMLHYLPVIYGLSDPNPLAVCSGRNHPDGTPVPPTERSYSNSCTIKRGSFGSAGLDNDELYSAGSEDFRAYVWKIPGLSELAEQRIEISSDEWAAREWSNTVAFTTGLQEPKYVPLELRTPLFRMTGHKSIINSTLIHPDLPYIVTAGVEKDILLHSPTSSSPSCGNMQRTPKEVRVLGEDDAADRMMYMQALAGFNGVSGEDSETMTIMMFDQLSYNFHDVCAPLTLSASIIREEGDVDVFGMRKWSEDAESSDEEADGGDDEVDADELL